MPSDDAAQFLASSPDRLTVLSDLFEGPASPAELAADHSFSRRSVQRNLAGFVDRGWAESTGGTYRLTVTGALVAEEHGDYVDALAHIEEFAPFFRHLPDCDHAPDPAWLADATLTLATEDDPQAPVHQYVTSVRRFDTERIRMLAPALSRLFHDAHAKVAGRGVETTLVMPAAMVERARERNPAEFKTIIALNILSLYRVSEPFRVGLVLGDTRLLMAAYDDEKQLQALVEADDPQFYEWASNLVEQYLTRAERVTR